MSNPKAPDSSPPVVAPPGTPMQQGSGMGGNADATLRQGQHRVSDRDGDNRRGAKGGRKGT